MDSVSLSKSIIHGSDSPEAVEAPSGIEMLVRPWAAAQRDCPSRGADDLLLPPELLALIEDILASRKATPVVRKDLICVSGFRQVNEALVAARQIQLAIQGFRQRNRSAPVAVSIAIDAVQPAISARDPGSVVPGPAHELVSLLRISRPAQVLVTHDAMQQISLSSGLPLKPFAGRFGVREYLWVDEDQLELLQSEPQLTLAIVTPETLTANPTAEQPPPRAAEPARSSVTSGAPPAHLGRSTALSERTLTSRWPRLLRSPRIWAVAGVPLLAVAIVAGLSLSRSPSLPAAPSSPGPARNDVSPPSPRISPPAATETHRPAHQIAAPPVMRPASTPDSAPKASPKLLKRRSSQTETIAAPPPAPEQSVLCSDLPALLKMAKVNRANGDLEDARNELNDILRCDPNNQDAKEELNRIPGHPE